MFHIELAGQFDRDIQRSTSFPGAPFGAPLLWGPGLPRVDLILPWAVGITRSHELMHSRLPGNRKTQ